jgi:O-acetyl-ADP-ribose deacetylase (regulator of RNase III)
MKPINRLEAKQGDITRLAVDAIVNAANTSLLGGGGVDGAIHRAAGPQLLAECRTVGGCPTGEARLTRGYELPAKYVIHTVGPIYRGRPKDPRLLASCYTNSLTLALDHGIQTLAFPAIRCGVYGYPVVDACKIAVDTCTTFMSNHDRLEKVIFMLFSTSNLEIYKRYLTLVAGHMR